MSPQLDPLAICALPANGLNERLAWIRSEILPHAVKAEQTSDGLVWELEDARGLAAKLDRLVALERECCSGIVFEHRRSATAGRLHLEVRNIDPSAAVFASLMAGPGQPPRMGTRLAKAATVGTVFSLVVCCALPLAAGALLGATAAAPIASLDRPSIIAGAAILAGGLAFAWQSRARRVALDREGAGASCGSGC